MNIFHLFLSMAILGFSPPLLATSPYQYGDDWHGILGLGMILHTQPYKDVDYKMLPLPYIIMRRGDFFIEGEQIGYHAIEKSGSHFDFIIKPRLIGFSAADSNYLSEMERRSMSLDGGVTTKWRQGMMEFNLTAVTDLLNKSDGQEISASLGNTYVLAGWMATLTPHLGLKWQSEDLVNYYYGVKPTEARANRPIYIGESTLNYYAAVNATYLLTKRSTLFAKVEYEYLGEEISDSPLLEQEEIITVFLGYGWQF